MNNISMCKRAHILDAGPPYLYIGIGVGVFVVLLLLLLLLCCSIVVCKLCCSKSDQKTKKKKDGELYSDDVKIFKNHSVLKKSLFISNY